MVKRVLGKTGEEVGVLGAGGFHLLEISDKDAVQILTAFLDQGGNYIETAAQYGDGESERKVGLVMKERRNSCFLTTKTHLRDRRGAAASLDESLKRLHTDYVDLFLFHRVQTDEELNQILGPNGAMEAFQEARKQGKIRYIGITGHGVPDVLIKAVESGEFEVLMTGFNFFDRCNFPDAEKVLLPRAKEKGMGVVGMKALADGLLWKFPEESFRYALTLPIDVIAAGFNTMDMLASNLEIFNNFTPMSDQEMERLFTHNEVLGNTICRLCGKCLPCPEEIDIPEVFHLEGWYDRQLRDRKIRDMPDFALRDRLRFWFENREKARSAYDKMEKKADACTECGKCVPRCPYGIDIIEKLENAHYKLSREAVSYLPI